MLKTVRSLNRKQVGVILFFSIILGVFGWQMLTGSEVDAKVKGLRTREAKLWDDDRKEDKNRREPRATPSSRYSAPTLTPTPTALPSVPTPTLVPTNTPTPTIAPTSSLTNTPTPTPTVAVSAAYPAQLLNLTNWKLTLPTGSSGSPTEIKQPALSAYTMDPWFIVSGGGVRFRAPVNGVTTSGSSYPRSELREMANNGSSNASWSSTSGTHSMYIDQAITAVPQTKKHVVAGQIHDAGDDVIVIRLEYPNLWVNVNGSNIYKLDGSYSLGKRFNVRLVASGGQTKVYYNGSSSPVYTLSKSYSGAYFKAGAYTQSNCSREAASACSSSNYGEVVIYQLNIAH